MRKLKKLQQHIEKTPNVNCCLFAGGLWRCPLCLQRLAKLYFPSYTDNPLAAHSLGPDFVAHLLVTIYTTRRYDTPRDLIVLLIRMERSLGNTVSSLLAARYRGVLLLKCVYDTSARPQIAVLGDI